jgi:hypothetical protein
MRKVWGIVLLVLGVLFVPLVVSLLFAFGKSLLGLVHTHHIEAFEELAGRLIALALIFFLDFVFFKYGYRLVKEIEKKNEPKT